MWGGVEAVPVNYKSGLNNLGSLIFDLTMLAEADYVHVRELNSLLDHDDEETFHDFRKRIRSVLKILGDFPQINANSTSDEVVNTLTTMVDLFGDLNDRLISYHKAEREDKEKKMKKIGKEVNKGLKNLLEWTEENNIVNALSELRNSILH